MKDNLKIYQKIRDLAHQGDLVYTRADLAYDLQELGIPNDCFEVGLLVWESYRHFNQDEKIRTFFYDNERKGFLVDEYQTDGLIAENDTDRLFEVERQRLADWNRAVATVEQSVTDVMHGEVLRAGNQLAGTIIGTRGVERVRQEATTVFNRYSTLVSHYDEARQQIQTLIADFVKLRAYICDIYSRYARILVDVFGDAIKVVAPELFDFETIGYLNVHEMMQQVQLDYNKINEKCAVLMSDISDSFAQSLKAASVSYKAAGSKQAGLVLAGLNMLSHYMETGEKVANLKQELLLLKNSVNHDVSLIEGDLGRLCVIYKSLNDVAIPQAEAFCRFAGQVLTDEWEQLVASFYDNEEIRGLKEERDVLLDKLKSTEQEMSDEEINIGYYSTRIEECRQLLDSMQAQYQEAMRTKPSKPFFLVNLLTLGASGRAYNRDIYEWNKACQPVITQYENLQVDVKLDSDELARQQAALKGHQAERGRLKQALCQQNEVIMKHLRVDQNIRIRMLPHLEAMISLLRLGRQMASTRLDRSLTVPVTVNRQNIRLPEEVSRKIGVFAQAVRENANVSPILVQHMMTSVESSQHETAMADRHDQAIGGEPATAAESNGHDMSGADQDYLAASGNRAVQDAAAFLEAAVRLEAMKVQNRIAEKKYNQELLSLQSRFREYLARIDDRSAVLRKSLQQVNTARNHEELKKGLLSLMDNDCHLISKEELEDFINGNRIIEL